MTSATLDGLAGSSRRPSVAMLLYPGLMPLDLVGPHQVFAPVCDVHLVAADLTPVIGDTGLVFQPTTTLERCPSQVDVVFVPGGMGTAAVLSDTVTLDFVRDRASRARYVTSVCTGSLILGAAGLLRGRRAATHWAARHLLASFGAHQIDERVVVDGNVITGGGVTAGLDFGLVVLAEILGADVARSIQLSLEYDPAPPFDAGHPDRADADTLRRVTAMLAASDAELRRCVDEAAAVRG